MLEGLNTYSSDSVKYRGKDYPELGIEKGMSLTEVVNKFNNKLEEFNTEMENLVTVRELINESMEYTGNTYAIGRGISIQGGRLSGRAAEYEISNSNNRNFFSIDINNLNLPSDMSYKASSITLTGKSKNGRNVIFSTTDKNRTTPVDLNRYPIHASINIRIATPGGELTLTGEKQFTESYNNSGLIRLRVEDNSNEPLNKQNFLERVAAKVSDLDNRMLILEGFEKDLYRAERNQANLEAKLDQLESAGNIVVDGEGNIVSPGNHYMTLVERIAALLKKN